MSNRREQIYAEQLERAAELDTPEMVADALTDLILEHESDIKDREYTIRSLEDRIEVLQSDQEPESIGPAARIVSIEGNRVTIDVEAFGDGATWSVQFYEGQRIEFREAVE